MDKPLTARHMLLWVSTATILALVIVAACRPASDAARALQIYTGLVTAFCALLALIETHNSPSAP